MKIAIQGGLASFHDMAARAYFPDFEIDIIECRTFRQQCSALTNGLADYAVMAIENSLAGSILPNYALLENFPVKIVGEVYLQIHQHLMAFPGQRLTDIESVRSHPMALHQCSEFLESQMQIRSVETHDTAESAAEIRKKKLKRVAAIASRLAAERYQLEILAQSIENDNQNYTRFLVLEKEQTKKHLETPNKASLMFHVKDEVGALADVLDVFRDRALNLALIQSTPIMGRPDEYAFHVDVTWQQQDDFTKALQDISRLTRELKILGKYRAGTKPNGKEQN
ncbi:MAG: prephenate dehydratase [bacterium]